MLTGSTIAVRCGISWLGVNSLSRCQLRRFYLSCPATARGRQGDEVRHLFLLVDLEISPKCTKIEMQATTFLRECEICLNSFDKRMQADLAAIVN